MPDTTYVSGPFARRLAACQWQLTAWRASPLRDMIRVAERHLPSQV